MRYVTVITAVMVLATAVWADDPPAPTDADAPAEGQRLAVTVVSVSGAAQYRSAADEDGQWLPLAAGAELSELAIIRTGLDTQVVLHLGDRSEITIRSATKVGIASLRAGPQERVTARVGLKYGSIHAQVDPSQGPNDFQIRTPVATLSVRGTGGNVGFGHQGMGTSGTDGTYNNDTSNGDTDVDEGEQSDEDGTPSGDLDEEDRNLPNGDPNGQGGDEEKNLDQNGGGRGGFDFIGNGESESEWNTPGETAGGSSSNGSENGENGENGYEGEDQFQTGGEGDEPLGDESPGEGTPPFQGESILVDGQ